MKRRPFAFIKFIWYEMTDDVSFELVQKGAKRCIARVRKPDPYFDEKEFHVAIFHSDTEQYGGGALAYGYSPTFKSAVNLAEAMILENIFARKYHLFFNRRRLHEL
jgi:hypothetical protein